MIKIIKRSKRFSLPILLIVILVSMTFFFTQRVQVDPDEYILAQMKDCKVLSNNKCYQDIASDFVSRFSLQKILEVFAKYENNADFFNKCHTEMHFIGREAYKQTKDIKKVMSQCNSVCLQGCYHGAVEEYFLEKNISLENIDNSLIVGEVPNICGKKEDYEQTELFYQCIHAIGHATMFLTEDDLPRSLKICDVLSEPRVCYTGVFMQNNNDFKSEDHIPTKYLKEEDPLYPCNVIADQYKEMCYSVQVGHFFNLTNFDWDKTVKLCQMVPAEYQVGCFSAMGANQVGFLSDIIQLNKNCLNTSDNKSKGNCIMGVARHLIIRYGGDITNSLNFCSLVDKENKQNCYSEIGRTFRDWAKDDSDLHSACSRINEKQYDTWCLRPEFN